MTPRLAFLRSCSLLLSITLLVSAAPAKAASVTFHCAMLAMTVMYQARSVVAPGPGGGDEDDSGPGEGEGAKDGEGVGGGGGGGGGGDDDYRGGCKRKREESKLWEAEERTARKTRRDYSKFPAEGPSADLPANESSESIGFTAVNASRTRYGFVARRERFVPIPLGVSQLHQMPAVNSSSIDQLRFSGVNGSGQPFETVISRRLLTPPVPRGMGLLHQTPGSAPPLPLPLDLSAWMASAIAPYTSAPPQAPSLPTARPPRQARNMPTPADRALAVELIAGCRSGVLTLAEFEDGFRAAGRGKSEQELRNLLSNAAAIDMMVCETFGGENYYRLPNRSSGLRSLRR